MANRIFFKDYGTETFIEDGAVLMDAVKKMNYSLETPCNCIGMCGKCTVIARGGLEKMEKEEKSFLSDSQIKRGYRLACVAKTKGDVVIEFLESDESLNVHEEASTEEKNLQPESSGKSFGVAVDIGTTGISSYLLDLETDSIVDRKSILNPQAKFGNDVLSRISFCMQEDGLQKLKESINSAVGQIVSGFSKKVQAKNISDIVISANTTMLHLFEGEDPSSIARFPYTPVFLEKREAPASNYGIEASKGAKLTLLPSSSSYIGADIISGLVATGFEDSRKNSVFVDIGTNGEIVINRESKLVATSTAAGPALEGMNISCGCRARKGAIDSFEINAEKEFSFTTIGSEKANGICGSGLIDIMAELVDKGIVMKSGKFNKKMDPEFLKRFKDKKFYIGEDIYISQKDIRQVQLAKGAIATGIRMAMDRLSMDACQVEEVVIAGSFGYHLNFENVKRIGLIPSDIAKKASFVGNSSLEGARMVLLNPEKQGEFDRLKDKIEVLELSTSEDFQDYFIRELGF